jgi:5'(3')-deoxyribonucleotidase
MTLKEKRLLMESLGKDAIVYCDMDGVLAKWEVGCTYEKTWEPEYFYGLELETCVKDALCLLAEAGFNICILSAAYEEGTARVDKSRWLDKYGMQHLDRLFVPCGCNKADFIDIKSGVNYILLDDYNFNLISWSETNTENSQFIAVKFLNGINGGGDTWKGRTIHHKSSGEIIAHTLADIAAMA